MEKNTRRYHLSDWVTIEERRDPLDPRTIERPSGRLRRRSRTFSRKNEGCAVFECEEEAHGASEFTMSGEFDVKYCDKHMLEAVALASFRYDKESIDEIVKAKSVELAKKRLRSLRKDRESATMRHPGWIYYIQVGDLLKIGYATTVWDRLMSYPPNITVLAIHPGTRELETHLHRKFRLLLQKGREWYADDGKIADHIGKVREEFGSPSDQIPGFGMDHCPWDVAA